MTTRSFDAVELSQSTYPSGVLSGGVGHASSSCEFDCAADCWDITLPLTSIRSWCLHGPMKHRSESSQEQIELQETRRRTMIRPWAARVEQSRHKPEPKAQRKANLAMYPLNPRSRN